MVSRATAAPPSLVRRALALQGIATAPGLRLVDGRIASHLSAGDTADPGDLRVHLPGDRFLPGLINAHDHLHRNSLPQLRYRARHHNIADWIADLDARRATDPVLRDDAARPRAQRFWHGAIKNLLSGVTTVVHHDAGDPALDNPSFPVHVVTHPAWTNALGIDGEAAVLLSHRQTPADQPWMIHAAEGIDAEAQAEFDTLDRLGCLTPNARLIHGVGLTAAQRDRLAERGAGLIWCPRSNLNLFGRTVDVRQLMRQSQVALGSDSRASGSRDLLEELALAHELQTLDAEQAQALVTTGAAALLWLPDRGQLGIGARADVIALPADLPLFRATRADLRLVMRDGRILLADPDVAEAFVDADLVSVHVDGRPKRLARAIADRLRAWDVEEAGLSFDPIDPIAPINQPVQVNPSIAQVRTTA